LAVLGGPVSTGAGVVGGSVGGDVIAAVTGALDGAAVAVGERPGRLDQAEHPEREDGGDADASDQVALTTHPRPPRPRDGRPGVGTVVHG
jgi:hypothetical protein